METGRLTLIRMGDNRFEFRRRSILSRRFDLTREGSTAAPGSTGQKSMFSTSLTSDLPPEVPTLLQAFLLALMFDMTFVVLDRSGY